MYLYIYIYTGVTLHSCLKIRSFGEWLVLKVSIPPPPKGPLPTQAAILIVQLSSVLYTLSGPIEYLRNVQEYYRSGST